MIKHTPETLQMVIVGLEYLVNEIDKSTRLICRILPERKSTADIDTYRRDVRMLIEDYEMELDKAKARAAKGGSRDF